MKMLRLTALALFFLATEVPTMSASSLETEKFTVSGTLYQPNPTATKQYLATPLTKKHLLALFGYPDVNPAKTKFFFDSSTGSDVLASADGNTIYGVLFTYGSGTPVIVPGINGKGADSNTATMFNGQLTGIYIRTSNDAGGHFKGTVTFSANGTLSGNPAIVKGTFTYSE